MAFCLVSYWGFVDDMDITTPFSLSDLIAGTGFGVGVLLLASIVLHASAERKTILAAMLVKLVATVAYGATTFYYYNGIADSISYHRDGVNYSAVIRADFPDGLLNYLTKDSFFSLSGLSTDRLSNLSGLTHFLLFDSFIASSFAFALIGFTGQLLIYRTFVARYPDSRIRVWWRVGILFFPTLTFWSSGILKEPLGLLGLGCVFWSVHSLIQSFSVGKLALAAFGLYTLILFRIQTVPVLMFALIPLLLETHRAREAQPVKAPSLAPLGPLMRVGLIPATLLGVWLVGEIQPNYSLARLPETVIAESSVYNLITPTAPFLPITTDASWTGLISVWPEATVLTLYRPFVWEAPGLVGQLAAVENLILFIITIRAVFHIFANPQAFVKALRSPMFVTCLIFVLLFTLALGASTPNLGTVSRYRIPIMPFFAGALVILEYYFLEFRSQMKIRSLNTKPYSSSLPSGPKTL